MAAMAAFRSGAGLVQIACPDSVRPTVASMVPCATTCSWGDWGSFDPTIRAIGPGCGKELEVSQLFDWLRDQSTPLVIDADGLNVLSQIKNWAGYTHQGMVLTPHPGEMSRLLEKIEISPEKKSPSQLAQAVAKQSNAIIVLKGHHSVVADPQRVYVNSSGNPGMATGGSGDVLTGVIAALIGQGLSNYDAACLGVHIHGLAGDLAAQDLGEISVTALDLIDSLPEAFLTHQGHYS